MRQSRILDIDYRSYDETFDSTSSCESESFTDSESSEEPTPRDKQFSKWLSMHLKDIISLADLQGLLQEQCPGEYAVMLRRSALKFEDWEDSKRLRIGGIRTPFDLTSNDVYAYIEGNKNNEVRLTQGSANEKLPLTKGYMIEIDQPFRDLCRNGRLFHAADKKRLRAAMCFWFLEAGHVRTMKRYRDFEKHLIEACHWLGSAVLREADHDGENNLDKIRPEDPVSQPDRAGHGSTSPYERRRSKSNIEPELDSVFYSKFFQHAHRCSDSLTAI